MSPVKKLNNKPDQYAVMGNPIAHSKSPTIHTLFAKQTSQELEYKSILVDLEGFADAVKSFIDNNGKGLNITVPFKQQAWELADNLSERAKRAQAVNTIIVNPDNTLTGDNTDGLGIIRDICINHSVDIKNLKVLVIGAGGAVRGILEPLINCAPSRITIVNRTIERAIELAESFVDLYPVTVSGFEQLEAQENQYDLIINGTSASLSGELPPLPDNILKPGGCCYDMMYSNEPTVFVEWAKQHGAAVALDGLGMLVEQAAESFQLWRGVRPDTADVISTLR